MLNFFKEYIRNKALKKRKTQVSSAFLNIKEVKSVGFVFGVSSLSDLEELHQVAAFFEKASVTWQGLAVELKKGLLKKAHAVAGGKMEMKGVTFLGKDQMNGAGVPKEGIPDSFQQQKFDLFISLNAAGDFTLDYLAGGMHARMSAGMHNTRYHSYPFVLGLGELVPAGYADYLKQLFYYLSIIQ